MRCTSATFMDSQSCSFSYRREELVQHVLPYLRSPENSCEALHKVSAMVGVWHGCWLVQCKLTKFLFKFFVWHVRHILSYTSCNAPAHASGSCCSRCLWLRMPLIQAITSVASRSQGLLVIANNSLVIVANQSEIDINNELH